MDGSDCGQIGNGKKRDTYVARHVGLGIFDLLMEAAGKLRWSLYDEPEDQRGGQTSRDLDADLDRKRGSSFPSVIRNTMLVKADFSNPITPTMRLQRRNYGQMSLLQATVDSGKNPSRLDGSPR
jgi:hypothetical protein